LSPQRKRCEALLHQLEAEPGPLADPQGTTKHPSDVVKFNDLDGEFVVR